MVWGSKPPPEEPPPEPPKNSKEAKAARRSSRNAPEEVNQMPEPPKTSKDARRSSKNAPEEVNPPPESARNSKVARRSSKNAPEELNPPPESARNSKVARRNSKSAPEEVNPPPEPPKSSREARRSSKNAPEEVNPPPEPRRYLKEARRNSKNPPELVNPPPEPPKATWWNSKNAPEEVNPPPEPPKRSREARRSSKNAPEEVNPPPEQRRYSKEARRNSKNPPELVNPPPEPPKATWWNSKNVPDEVYPAPESARNSKARNSKIAKNAPPIVGPRPVNRVNHAGLYKATFYSNIGTFFFGISMGWTGGAESSVLEKSSYDFTPTAAQWDCVCMLLTLGAMAWSMPMGFLLRAFGCKRTILVQLLPNTLGWCLTIWAQSISMLYVGRFILGMCGGAHCVVVPIYSAEISPVKKRGVMGVCCHGAYIVGVIYSFMLCSFVDLRLVNIINLAMLLLGLLQILMPESPAYYVNRGNIPRAEKTLRWLRGKDYNMSREMASLTRELSSSDHDLRRRPLLAFKQKNSRRCLGRTVVLGMLQKLSGAFVFILYGHQVLVCQKLQYQWIGALAGAAVLGFLLCFLLVERVGRRLLIISSSAVAFFASIIMGLCLKLWQDNDGQFIHWISLFSMTLFVGAYSVGLGSLTWLVTVEMFVPPMRWLGCSISATFSWLTAFFVIFWYSAATDICQPYLFLLFAIIAVISLLFTLVYIPETKGQSPKRIQQRMGGIMNAPTVVIFTSSSDESNA